MKRIARVRARLAQTIPYVAAMAVAASPAYAAMDVQAGVITLATALLVVMGALCLVVCGWKGIEAVMNHSSVMPALMGMIIGLTMVFGGAWYLTQLGAGGGSAAVLNL
jgi:hypothetical protein